MVFITFEKIQDARTGNVLFQYLATKVISIKYGHIYKPWEELDEKNNGDDSIIKIDDSMFVDVLQGKNLNLSNKHIICRGFFQNSEYYVPLKKTLLEELSDCNDYWYGVKGRKQYIREFMFYFSHSIQDLSEKDVVLSLRLDDFIQLPCPTSDIVSPEYYLEILENMIPFERLIIVCDTIRHDWEHRYLEFFKKWDPILIQSSLEHDCALMRDAPILLHSNSTLCWIMSFLSLQPKKRFIPKTNFYSGQNLNKIDEETDTLTIVAPLYHQSVYHLNYHDYLKKHIYPLSYSIPDECIVDYIDVVSRKTTEFAGLNPKDKNTYKFNAHDEDSYHKMYQNSLFAQTMKKGGWDCLRHYEILANGCIPIFENLDLCPSLTLTTLPKELLKEASEKLLPWNYDNKPLYNQYLKKILEHTKSFCSTSESVQYFFSVLPKEIKEKTRNVLLIMGNCGVNYSRETFWIGMKRYIQSIGGVAVEYPKIDFLYKNYQGEKENLYGKGYTYAYRLDDDYSFTNEEIEKKIEDHFFDMIIYGKVGPDEGYEGSIPSMPLWNRVVKKYNKNQLVFLYGGDECINLTTDNHYHNHILSHSQFAHCFVRELNMF